jgi:beta-glucosidase-like glycosyl hydrolase
MGEIMGLEARAKFNTNAQSGQGVKRMGGLSFFSPNVNLYTHYNWGRGQASDATNLLD